MPETKSNQRFHSLNVEQVEVLHQVLSEVVPIHGRGNFPTLELRPRDIIIAVRARLQKQGITVRDVRLNGSTASHVLVRDNGTSYKDLDIIFGVELPSQEEFQVIKESVLGCLLDCLPAGVNRERISSATMKEAYVQKMVKVFNEHDRWSLISLSNNSGKNLELKFVNALRRQFEFSVDSFQIILDRLLESYMQQGSQHKRNVVKEQAVEKQKKDSAPQTETSAHGDTARAEGEQIGQAKVKDEMQTDQLDEREHSNKTTRPNVEEDGKKKTPSELRVSTENSTENSTEADSTDRNLQNHNSEKKQSSEKTATPAQIELRQNSELSDEITISAEEEEEEEEHSEETQPCEDQPPTRSHHQELSVQRETSEEQEDLTQQMADAELPETLTDTQATSPNQAGKSQTTEYSEEKHNEVEKWSEGVEERASPNLCPRVETETPLEEKSDIEIETGEQVQAEWTGEPELGLKTDKTAFLSQTPKTEGEQDTHCSCTFTSTPLTFTDTQPAGTQDAAKVHGTAHNDDDDRNNNNNSENQPHVLESNSPHDTQDTFPAPPGLVSDRKTVSPSLSKASGRLSHMVVLKHTSPKRPRKMCRKVASSLASEREPLTLPCLDTTPCPSPEPELVVSPESAGAARGSDHATTTTITFTDSPETNCEPGTDFTSHLDFASSRESLADVVSTPAVEPVSLPLEPLPPQHITDSSCETRTHSHQDASPTPVDPGEQTLPKVKEIIFRPEDSEPPDSVQTLVSKTDTCDAQEHLHTSEAELSDEGERKTTAFASLCPSRPVNSAVTCLTPPMLSLSPPCFTPSPPSLSPPPCLTPPSHCLSSPLQSTASQATSFGSPPLSFSPTSSCLSSPPYLTPPMVSLSPPPVCLTPPSPCLSPPLLCLTPPVESEDLVLQVSSDLEPLILNTDSEDQNKPPPSQPQVSLLQVGEKMEQDFVPPLPQVAEPVSFPITIPSSNSHVLPNPQSGCTGKSDPPRSEEVPDPFSENREPPEVTTDMPEQTNAPSASDSVPDVEVLAESMYGDFDAAMDHLRYRLIATRNPEEIRGGGLLKYSNLLVRDYRPASETQIKTLERYMCSRFFIDFPDVQEQQRKILSYLKNHFIGEERSKYQYLMTLRRVVDDSTVCLMGHERRQTLNMITVLALKVLGEQNIIPNTDHVTCFYQPAPYLAEHSAPYLAEPSYCSYYIPQGGTTLLYQPYPLHLHSQTGLV